MVLMRRRTLPSRDRDRGQQIVQALGWTVGVSIIALLFGAIADKLVAVEITTGSWTSRAIAGALLIVLAARIGW